jgi:hypothetical protein
MSQLALSLFRPAAPALNANASADAAEKNNNRNRKEISIKVISQSLQSSFAIAFPFSESRGAVAHRSALYFVDTMYYMVLLGLGRKASLWSQLSTRHALHGLCKVANSHKSTNTTHTLSHWYT